jgi:hypothetical protein
LIRVTGLKVDNRKEDLQNKKRSVKQCSTFLGKEQNSISIENVTSLTARSDHQRVSKGSA